MAEDLIWMSEEPDAEPLTTRSITMRCFDDGDQLEVLGRLTDSRDPSKVIAPGGVIHDMELRMKVDPSTFLVTAAKATMRAHPHVDCSDIEPAFEQLVGLSVMRGYNKKVQELLGRSRGCSHLEFLARAMGPVVIQGVTTRMAGAPGEAADPSEVRERVWLKDTCHMWSDDGPAPVKISLGWRPGTISPVPRVEWFAAQAAVAAQETETQGADT
jgi:hypothetical protein